MEAKLKRVAAQVDRSLTRRDAAIREAAASGMSYRRIADLVGLTYGRIGQIVRDR
jgi:hypothetical protein